MREVTDPAKPLGDAEEKLIAALVDAIWEDRYGGVSRDWATAEARALLAAYTAKVREEDAKAVCSYCRGEHPHISPVPVLVDGQWRHEPIGGQMKRFGWRGVCDAAAIRARGGEEQDA